MMLQAAADYRVPINIPERHTQLNPFGPWCLAEIERSTGIKYTFSHTPTC